MSIQVTGSKGLNTENAKAIGIILIVIAVIIIAYFIIKNVKDGLLSIKNGADSLLQTIGAQDSPEVAAAKAKINQAQNDATKSQVSYWTPNYYENAPSGATMLPYDSTLNACQEVYGAYGFFSYLDQPDQALAAFKQMPSKNAVSYMAIVWQEQYNGDLLAWITKKSDTDKDKVTLASIIAYCDTLPAY